MVKVETVLYKGEDGTLAMEMYKSLVNHKELNVPIRISEPHREIYKDNVCVTDVIKTFRDGNHIVSVKYDQGRVKYTKW